MGRLNLKLKWCPRSGAPILPHFFRHVHRLMHGLVGIADLGI